MKKFIACIAIGTPLWYVIGLLITLSPEFAKVLGVQGEISTGQAVLWCYSGQIVGDLSSGLISQYFQSRRKCILLFLILTLITVALYFFVQNLTVQQFLILCFFMGIAIGYWAMFVAISAERIERYDLTSLERIAASLAGEVAVTRDAEGTVRCTCPDGQPIALRLKRPVPQPLLACHQSFVRSLFSTHACLINSDAAQGSCADKQKGDPWVAFFMRLHGDQTLSPRSSLPTARREPFGIEGTTGAV
jgi:hypothetical protein